MKRGIEEVVTSGVNFSFSPARFESKKARHVASRLMSFFFLKGDYVNFKTLDVLCFFWGVNER